MEANSILKSNHSWQESNKTNPQRGWGWESKQKINKIGFVNLQYQDQSRNKPVSSESRVFIFN